MPRRFRSKTLPEVVPAQKTSAFGGAMAWLVRRGVPADRLASCFGTTRENVRVQIYRARHPPLIQPWFASVLPDPKLAYEPGLHDEVLGLRPYDEFTSALNEPLAKLDDLEDGINRVVDEHRNHYQFLRGAKALLQIRRSFGHTSNPRRLALRALLHEKTSWFLVHSGFTISAVSDATWALWLYQFANTEQPDHRYLDGYVRSALIASHANLLAHRPRAALDILDLARDAANHRGSSIGSDHFRQRGVALFQLGERQDEQARSNFVHSANAMVRLGEARSEAHVLMTGSRHTNIMGRPNWEQALSLLDTCGGTFVDDSLEMSMNRHWAAACGFATDDHRVHLDARNLLAANERAASRFGHQATIHKLLSITPDLKLDPRLIRVWIRWLLYENSFRSR